MTCFVYLNHKFPYTLPTLPMSSHRQSGAEESGDQVPPEGIVVEGNNIEKCFTERPPGGGRARLYPKRKTICALLA